MAIIMSTKKRRRAVQETAKEDNKIEHNNNLLTTTTTNDNNTMMLLSNNGSMYSNSIQGVYTRIRTPHEHDVLSGRGGGINAHMGNVQFREWVRVRKNEYNLAPTKVEKSRVAQEVIDLVRNQKPPGRFLQKDTTGGVTGGWWVEIDDERIMAKTSQALREGAPQIRAAHQTEPTKTKSGRKSIRKGPLSHIATPASVPSGPITSTPFAVTSAGSRGIKRPLIEASPLEDEAILHLDSVAGLHTSHVELSPHLSTSVAVVKDEDPFDFVVQPPTKRVRLEYNGHTVVPTDDTPPSNGRSIHPVFGLPPPLDLTQGGGREHSLALPEIDAHDEWSNEDFVNPFENEGFLESGLSPLHHASPVTDIIPRQESEERVVDFGRPKHGIFHRESSTSSDMGGLGALMEDSPKEDSPQEEDDTHAPATESLVHATKSNDSLPPAESNDSLPPLLDDDSLLLDPLHSLNDIHNNHSGSTLVQ